MCLSSCSLEGKRKGDNTTQGKTEKEKNLHRLGGRKKERKKGQKKILNYNVTDGEKRQMMKGEGVT